ncbi:hypothetical protein ABZ297_05035 [Nonomuraea sp. NPDC005983]|uniref:hypothetical protein n=1 Tax=Nonomuraea sp. NPDC005983 TaxID=3155595 RepID=UPI0033B19422
MPSGDSVLEEQWKRLRPDLLDAYSTLVEQLKGSTSHQDLLDAYLAAKRLSAAAYQALLRANIPDQETAWQTVRHTLEYEMEREYGHLLPDWARKIPYNSRTHQELFSLLAERLGQAVPGDYLRVVTADAVHAERRVRELRELGLPVVSAKMAETDTYSLRSVEIDKSYIHSIVTNTVKANRSIPEAEKKHLLSLVRG